MLASLSKRLQERLSLPLPGEVAHQYLMPSSRPLSSRAKQQFSSYRESAVCIVLYPNNDRLKLSLILRPPYDGAHGGQISFPGGKRDATDSSLQETAIRECKEEIDVDLPSDSCLGQLTEVFIPVSKFLVQPFLFLLDEKPEMTGDQREVEQILEVDLLDELLNNDHKRTNIPLPNGIQLKEIPYFDIQGHIVWGATSMMLSELKELFKDVQY